MVTTRVRFPDEPAPLPPDDEPPPDVEPPGDEELPPGLEPLPESGVVVPVTSPFPLTVAFFPEETDWFFPSLFVTDTTSPVLFVTSTDLSAVVVFTVLPSAPFDRLISVSAAAVTEAFTLELMVVPFAFSPTLTLTSSADVP